MVGLVVIVRNCPCRAVRYGWVHVFSIPQNTAGIGNYHGKRPESFCMIADLWKALVGISYVPQAVLPALDDVKPGLCPFQSERRRAMNRAI